MLCVIQLMCNIICPERCSRDDEMAAPESRHQPNWTDLGPCCYETSTTRPDLFADALVSYQKHLEWNIEGGNPQIRRFDASSSASNHWRKWRSHKILKYLWYCHPQFSRQNLSQTLNMINKLLMSFDDESARLKNIICWFTVCRLIDS